MGTEEPNLPKLAAPARRALHGAGYTRLEDLTKVTESDVMKLHGMGQCHAGAPQRPEGARPVLPRWMSSHLKRSSGSSRGTPRLPAAVPLACRSGGPHTVPSGQPRSLPLGR
jgi:hypothetical protein